MEHDTKLEALLQAELLDDHLQADLDDAGFFACNLDKSPYQWKPTQSVHNSRIGMRCRKQSKDNSSATGPWQVITETWETLSSWKGTFSYDGSTLVEGSILSCKHSDITRIINDIRLSHSEYALTPKTRVEYAPSLNNVRLVCCHGVYADDTECRERKTRTRRAHGEDDCCPSAINLYWAQVRKGVYAWRVGKLVPGHENHLARVHKEVNLTQEQRETIGAEMVDAHLTAAQVSTFGCSM
jgi:hypothetical protein